MTAPLPRLAALALAAGGLLAGCATAPPPPAALTYAGHGCAAAPDLAKAVSLTPEKPKAMYVVTTPVTAQSPCLDRAEGARPYVLYALPKDLTGKTLMVGSVLEGVRIFSPEIVVLNAAGEAVRGFRPEDYFYRADVYSVEFQPKSGEAFIVVAADPARVAQKRDSIAIGTSTTYISAGTAGGMTWTSGVDQKQSRTFSYDGAVQVTVYDAEAAKRKK